MSLLYRYAWGPRFRVTGLPVLDRKGQLCTVLARGAMNSAQVCFLQDGHTAIVSRNALRKFMMTIPTTERIDAAVSYYHELHKDDDLRVGGDNCGIPECNTVGLALVEARRFEQFRRMMLRAAEGDPRPLSDILSMAMKFAFHVGVVAAQLPDGKQ